VSPAHPASCDRTAPQKAFTLGETTVTEEIYDSICIQTSRSLFQSANFFGKGRKSEWSVRIGIVRGRSMKNQKVHR